ncbi:MAG: hypothetical protein ACYTGX_15295 [Planctomycetota bacterium]|jgi:hypothetical protein
MRAALLFLIWPLLAGCALFPNMMPAGTTTGPRYAGTDPVEVWAAVKDAFAADWHVAHVDDSNYELESEWDTQLAPMYRKGRRRKASVWLIEDERGPSLSVQILREVNRDRERPMDAGSAVWEADGRDTPMEQRLLRAVELRLGKVHDAPGAGGRRPSPYREDETEAEKQKRLWGEK